MEIRTIEDFLRAGSKDIDAIKRAFDPLGDLQKHLAWMNSPNGHRIESTYRIGYSGGERKGGLHSSAMAKPGRCKLAHYYDVVQEDDATQSVGMEMQLIFDHGTVLHSLFQTYFLDIYEHEDGEGNDFVPEVHLQYPELLYSSTHGDGIFDFRDSALGYSFRVLLEIKSAKEGGTKGIEHAMRKPFVDNVRQTMQYMKFADIPFGYILYYCKNNGKMYGHLITWDQKMWDSIEAEAQVVVDAVHAGTPPEPKIGSHCSDCQWRKVCPHGKRFLSERSTRKRDIALAKSRVRRRG